MEDIKIDYLERIKALLESDEIANLTKFIVRIKKKVDGDPVFEEILGEIDKKNFDLALNITEEAIYENSENEFKEEFEKETEEESDESGFYSSQFNENEEYGERDENL